MDENFLRQQARTQHFTLGAPRSFALNHGQTRLFFVRSRGPEDALGCLWSVDLQDDHMREQLLVDPAALTAKESLTSAERARRERARETAGGIVNYSIDLTGERAVFTLGVDLYIWEKGQTRCLLAGAHAYDPRISPDGQRVAFVSNGDLCMVRVAPEVKTQVLAHDENPDITWGQADFIAAEEMDRLRGFWWAPDSQAILAERADNTPVQEWYIADPAHPTSKPQKVRYPAAGTANAEVSLAIISTDGQHTAVSWPVKDFEYLVDVQWQYGRPLITVQSRDQKMVQLRQVAADGSTRVLAEVTDQDWVELVDPPLELADGSVLHIADTNGQRLVMRGDLALTDAQLIPRGFHGATTDGTAVLSAWQDDPKHWDLWELSPDGAVQKITPKSGVYSAVVRGDTMLLHTQNMQTRIPEASVWQKTQGNWQQRTVIEAVAAVPSIEPKPRFYTSTNRKLQSALLLPQSYDGEQPLPVILNPYGGPHAQQVLASGRAYLDAQWWANQGFAVLITDGRGTPGRGPVWEKAVAGDLISVVLEDQIAALQNIAAKDSRLDLGRVGIRGWSFGGYLAAYAVVRHPDVFHAAVAGAPVTDWRLYDTHYTERYLGDPQLHAAAYDACSLLEEAATLQRPLLLIHGLADDNVVAAHSLQFSSALVAAGRPHAVLPLSGATHMASGEVLAENLEKLQLAFLRKELQAPRRL